MAQPATNARAQYPNWCATYNFGGAEQPSEEDARDWFEYASGKSYYAIAGFEEAPSTGQRHLQCYFQFSGKFRLTQLKKFPGGLRVHWEPARGDERSNVDYCSKGGETLQGGSSDEPRRTHAGKREQSRWAEALKCAKQGRIEDVDPQIQITHMKNLEYIKLKYLPKPPNLKHTNRMLWIYGPSGTGKSRGARNMIGNETWYDKSQNKWWDWYDNEKYVLIDDLDKKNAEVLVSFLKRWLDIYPFVAEGKGFVAKWLRPERFIITSNWHPYEIWGGQPSLLDPILRRLVIKYLGPQPEPEYGDPLIATNGTYDPQALDGLNPWTGTEGLPAATQPMIDEEASEGDDPEEEEEEEEMADE